MPSGTKLAFISGQGGDNPDGSFAPDFRTHPAATLIPVPCLALPQMEIEVEAVVAVPGA